MKRICKLGSTVYGFVETQDDYNAVRLEKNKEYELKKAKNENYGTYYKVYVDGKCITTLSEAEVELFFGD